MKTILIACIASITMLCSFTDASKNANVEQLEGVYIYYRSKPVSEYDYLGTYKMGGLISSNKPKYLMEVLIKKTKEKYPLMEGIIVSEDMYQCDAIKFKK